jgi:hypothetical protein
VIVIVRPDVQSKPCGGIARADVFDGTKATDGQRRLGDGVQRRGHTGS